MQLARTPVLKIRSWTAAFHSCPCRVYFAQRRQEVNPGVPRARQKRVKLLRLRQSLVVQAAIGRHMQVVQAAGAALPPLFPPSRRSLIILTSWPDRSLLLFCNLLSQIRSTRSCMLHNQPHSHLPLQRILHPVRLIRSSHRNLVGATLLSVSTSLSNMRRPILRLPVSWLTSDVQIQSHGRRATLGRFGSVVVFPSRPSAPRATHPASLR